MKFKIGKSSKLSVYILSGVVLLKDRIAKCYLFQPPKVSIIYFIPDFG